MRFFHETDVLINYNLFMRSQTMRILIESCNFIDEGNVRHLVYRPRARIWSRDLQIKLHPVFWSI